VTLSNKLQGHALYRLHQLLTVQSSIDVWPRAYTWMRIESRSRSMSRSERGSGAADRRTTDR